MTVVLLPYIVSTILRLQDVLLREKASYQMAVMLLLGVMVPRYLVNEKASLKGLTRQMRCHHRVPETNGDYCKCFTGDLDKWR